MKFLQSDLGFYFKTSEVFVFFGNTNATLEKIKLFFSEFEFFRVRQTHSDILVHASPQLVEADAHFTDQKNTALLIATADCIPLMIYCRQTKRVAAIHAGWKGVANQITLKTLQNLILSGSTEKNFEFWFGPHILQNSFEVSSEVFSQLKNNQYLLLENDYAFEKNSKYYVHLQKIVVSQIEFILQKKFSGCFLDLDTKTNLLFHSYRRGKEAPDRNLSFIVLL